MALSKIQAESMNLADTYAFSGTVTGSGMDLLLDDTISSAVAQYDISSTYINGTYDDYILSFNLAPATNDVHLDTRVFVGGTIQTGSIYGFENSHSGSSSYDSSNASTVFRQTLSAVGNASGEYISGRLHLRNVNSTTFGFNYIGGSNMYNASGNHISENSYGMLIIANRANVVNGFRLFFSSGNIATGTVKLFGVRS